MPTRIRASARDGVVRRLLVLHTVELMLNRKRVYTRDGIVRRSHVLVCVHPCVVFCAERVTASVSTL